MRITVRTLSIINLQGTREEAPGAEEYEAQRLLDFGSVSATDARIPLRQAYHALTFKGSPIHFVCMECIYVPRPPRCQAPFGLRNETHGCMSLNNHKISKCV